jgi:hypothetical protein
MSEPTRRVRPCRAAARAGAWATALLLSRAVSLAAQAPADIVEVRVPAAQAQALRAEGAAFDLCAFAEAKQACLAEEEGKDAPRADRSTRAARADTTVPDRVRRLCQTRLDVPACRSSSAWRRTKGGWVFTGRRDLDLAGTVVSLVDDVVLAPELRVGRAYLPTVVDTLRVLPRLRLRLGANRPPFVIRLKLGPEGESWWVAAAKKLGFWGGVGVGVLLSLGLGMLAAAWWRRRKRSMKVSLEERQFQVLDAHMKMVEAVGRQVEAERQAAAPIEELLASAATATETLQAAVGPVQECVGQLDQLITRAETAAKEAGDSLDALYQEREPRWIDTLKAAVVAEAKGDIEETARTELDGVHGEFKEWTQKLRITDLREYQAYTGLAVEHLRFVAANADLVQKLQDMERALGPTVVSRSLHPEQRRDQTAERDHETAAAALRAFVERLRGEGKDEDARRLLAAGFDLASECSALLATRDATARFRERKPVPAQNEWSWSVTALEKYAHIGGADIEHLLRWLTESGTEVDLGVYQRLNQLGWFPGGLAASEGRGARSAWDAVRTYFKQGGRVGPLDEVVLAVQYITEAFPAEQLEASAAEEYRRLLERQEWSTQRFHQRVETVARAWGMTYHRVRYHVDTWKQPGLSAVIGQNVTLIRLSELVGEKVEVASRDTIVRLERAFFTSGPKGGSYFDGLACVASEEDPRVNFRAGGRT